MSPPWQWQAARGRLAALAGAVSMFLIQPPADWWLLAWLAPLPWLWLVAQSPAAAAASRRLS